MDPRPLLAQDYNHIPQLQHQKHDLDPRHLKAIGELYVRTGAHRVFGLKLLHRHVELKAEQIMVHSTSTAGTGICTPIQLNEGNESTFEPHSFLLSNEAVLRPFEFQTKGYSQRMQDAQQEDFLGRMRDYLVQENLGQVCAVTPALPAETVECELSDQEGTLYLPQSSFVSKPEDAFMTGWRFFDGGNGEVISRPDYVCIVDQAGFHRRLPVPKK